MVNNIIQMYKKIYNLINKYAIGKAKKDIYSKQ